MQVYCGRAGWVRRLVLPRPGCVGRQACSQSDSHASGLSKAYTCSLPCTMAQTLVFLVLIMDIPGLPQERSSCSCPQAVARSACRGELDEDPKRRPWMLHVREGSKEKAERKWGGVEGGSRRGSGTHTPSKSLPGCSEKGKILEPQSFRTARGARQFHHRHKDLSLEKGKGKCSIERVLANQTMRACINSGG